MEFIHLFFLFSQTLTAILLFLSPNPMHSILFMIFLFFESAIILLLFQLDFFAFLFIIVYVGAVAVLFLFVVMLLDVKYASIKLLFFFPLNFFFNAIFINYCYVFFNSFFLPTNLFILNSKFLDVNFDFLSDLIVIAQILFNYFLICFLIAGLILLIALIGAIVLSYDFHTFKTRGLIYRQLSRNSNFLAFFQ